MIEIQIRKLKKAHALRKKAVIELRRHERSIAENLRAALSECGAAESSPVEENIADITAVKSLKDAANEVILAQEAVNETEMELHTLVQENETLEQQLRKVMHRMTASYGYIFTFFY